MKSRIETVAGTLKPATVKQDGVKPAGISNPHGISQKPTVTSSGHVTWSVRDILFSKSRTDAAARVMRTPAAPKK